MSIPAIKERITPICRRYGVKKAYLFGSYARGEETEASDIDLRIEKGSIKSLFTLIGFRLDIMEVLQKDVDLLSVLPESKTFKTNLSHDEVLLYESD